MTLIASSVGCNSFGNGKLVQQLQNENERLLTEFRAERSRREEFERQNKTLEARLSESEKLLARQTQGPASSRVSSLPPSVGGLLNGLPALKPGGGGGAADFPNAAQSGDDGFRWQRRVN